MRSIINSFVTAVGMYSRIPVPKVEQNAKNRKYSLCFLPLIGGAPGALLYGWSQVCYVYGFGQQCFALVGAVIPILLIGGIHIEGFAGTCALLRREKEKGKAGGKGFYADTAVVCYFFLYAAGLMQIWKGSQLILLVLSFVVSRTLFAMSLVWFREVRKDEPIYQFVLDSPRRTVRVVLVVVLALCFATGVMAQPVLGSLAALAAMWVWTYYYYVSKNKFGGVTEELAGYFLCLCELVQVLVIGLLGRIPI